MTHYSARELYFGERAQDYVVYATESSSTTSIDAQTVFQAEVSCSDFVAITSINIPIVYAGQIVVSENFIAVTSINTVDFDYAITNSNLNSTTEFEFTISQIISVCSTSVVCSFSEPVINYGVLLSTPNFINISSLESSIWFSLNIPALESQISLELDLVKMIVVCDDFVAISDMHADVVPGDAVGPECEFVGVSSLESDIKIKIEAEDLLGISIIDGQYCSVINSLDLISLSSINADLMLGDVIASEDLIALNSIEADTWFLLNIPNFSSTVWLEGFSVRVLISPNLFAVISINAETMSGNFAWPCNLESNSSIEAKPVTIVTPLEDLSSSGIFDARPCDTIQSIDLSTTALIVAEPMTGNFAWPSEFNSSLFLESTPFVLVKSLDFEVITTLSGNVCDILDAIDLSSIVLFEADAMKGKGVFPCEFETSTQLETNYFFSLFLSEELISSTSVEGLGGWVIEVLNEGFASTTDIEAIATEGIMFESTPLEVNCLIEADTWFSLSIPNLNVDSNVDGFPCEIFSVTDLVGISSIEADTTRALIIFPLEVNCLIEADTWFSLKISDFEVESFFESLPGRIIQSSDFSNLESIDIYQVSIGHFIYPIDLIENCSIEADTWFSLNIPNLNVDSNVNGFPCWLIDVVSEYESFSQLEVDDVSQIWRLIRQALVGLIGQSSHIMHHIPLSNQFIFALNIDVCDSANFNFITHNTLRDSDIQTMFAVNSSIGDNVALYKNLMIADGFEYIQYSSNLLSDDPINLIQYKLNDLVDYVFLGTQYLNLDIESKIRETSLWYDPPPTPQLGSAPIILYIYFEITVDGISIKDKITDINISLTESDIINHIEVEFKDTTFFDVCDIAGGTGMGTERIEIKIGGDLNDPNKHTSYKFLLEERSGSESNHSFSIWGRQKAALLTEPFSESITRTYENTSSQDIATDLAGSIGVEWAVESHVYDEFNLDGDPLSGIQQLAEAIGAIVRTKSDGSLIVRAKFPKRPGALIDGVDTEGNPVVPNAILDRYSHIVSSDYSEEQSQFNTVEVQGGGSGENIEVSISSYESYFDSSESKSDFEPNQTVFLRVYHTPGIVYDPLYLIDNADVNIGYIMCSTSGQISLVRENMPSVVKDEQIDIINGSGTISHYCKSVIAWHWVGTPKFGDCVEGNEIITVDGTQVFVKDNNDNGVTLGKLKITYTTEYDLFQMTDCTVGEVLVGVLVSEDSGIYLKITMDTVSNPSEEKPAPKVEDSLIIYENMALLKGQSILDDTYYKKLKYNLQIPYYLDQGLSDGEIVRLEDDFWNIIGNGIIRSANISISLDGDVIKVWQNLEVHQFQRP